MPRRVKIASWLAFGLHGILILSGRYRLSYDAYNHMFFADHYRLDWWSLWESRWYTGFEIVSYPPLVHQLNALIGHLIGVDAAFALLLWITLTVFPLAVYLFARIFVGRIASGYTAIGTALLPSLYLTAHVFGQLPTLFATLLALFGVRVLADFLHYGGILTAFLAVCMFATVMAAHHATLLFLPWLVGSVVLKTIIDKKTERPLFVFRLVVVIGLVALAGWLVIFPFWQWGAVQTLQTTIDHASRHSYLRDPFAAVLFFLPVYGLLIPFLPLALWMGRLKRFWGPGIAFTILFLLGLGDTTPLPRLFFGPGWTWLTYDRFAFWASLILLVFFGEAVVIVRRKFSVRHTPRSRTRLSHIFLLGMILTALQIGLIPTWLPTQPPQLDMRPILDFLAEGDHSQYRYITFGFGDQLAYLSRLTEATTIDGSYHTARALPELRASGIGQIDTAYWIPGGLNALDPILQKSGDRGVRWGFVNSKFFVPILRRNGWRSNTTLSNGVVVWENPGASRPPPVEPPAEKPFTAFAWGTFPMAAFFVSGMLTLRRYRPALSVRLLPSLQTFAIGLLPVGLSFWFYRRLFSIPHERVYFTYSDALFFLSDGIALVAVLAWLVNKLPKVPIPGLHPVRKMAMGAGAWLFAFCALASLSILWSGDWRTSLYVSLQCWLVFGLVMSLRETPGAWRSFAIGSAAALFLQVIIGVWQFTAQSTSITMALGSDWPGNLSPAMSGASVVQLAEGTRWLRAYGSLPHPNILAGWTLALLTPLLAVILLQSKWRIPALILFTAGLVLLVLAFSRSAWLGLAALGVVLLYHWKRLDNRSLITLIAAGLFCLTMLFIPLRQIFATRLTDSPVQTEQVSSFTRTWLVQRTWEIIRQRPVTGVGVGSYPLALSGHVAEFYDIEPVHNIPLLVWSELGIGGVIAMIGLAVMVTFHSARARHPLTIIFSAGLAGLFVVGLFDHYLWTLAPGRLLAGTMLGLWAGQVYDECSG